MLEKSGDKTGKLLKSLKKDIDQPLAAILSLNTIAHTIGAAGVGAQAQIVFGNAYVTITSIILTLLILVFSEIIPKTLGASYWKKLSGFSARITNILIVVTYPFVLLSKGITKLISSDENQPSISREEIGAMADLGHQEGIFEKEESKILRNLIKFSSLKVEDIMTPRIVVVKYSEETSIKHILNKEDELRVSRVPVYGKSDEDITGYVLKNDMYLELSKGNEDTKLKDLKRDVMIVPETSSIMDLFEKLLESQDHIAIAVDEYGGFSGVATMEDVVETLLGMEIVDEIDAIDDMQKLARQQWRERAKNLGIQLPESAKSDVNLNK
jgi:CBS domain containing-hemolysin-like protein